MSDETGWLGGYAANKNSDRPCGWCDGTTRDRIDAACRVLDFEIDSNRDAWDNAMNEMTGAQNESLVRLFNLLAGKSGRL